MHARPGSSPGVERPSGRPRRHAPADVPHPDPGLAPGTRGAPLARGLAAALATAGWSLLAPLLAGAQLHEPGRFPDDPRVGRAGVAPVRRGLPGVLRPGPDILPQTGSGSRDTALRRYSGTTRPGPAARDVERFQGGHADLRTGRWLEAGRPRFPVAPRQGPLSPMSWPT